MKKPLPSIRPWSQEDDRALLKLAQTGERALNIALTLRRAERSVIKRLAILKVLEADEAQKPEPSQSDS